MRDVAIQCIVLERGKPRQALSMNVRGAAGNVGGKTRRKCTEAIEGAFVSPVSLLYSQSKTLKKFIVEKVDLNLPTISLMSASILSG